MRIIEAPPIHLVGNKLTPAQLAAADQQMQMQRFAAAQRAQFLGGVASSMTAMLTTLLRGQVHDVLTVVSTVLGFMAVRSGCTREDYERQVARIWDEQSALHKAAESPDKVLVGPDGQLIPVVVHAERPDSEPTSVVLEGSGGGDGPSV